MIYAVSDLHGYNIEKFLELLAKAEFSDSDRLFIIGDVIDRGSDGVKLLKWAMEQHNVILIMGNHEDMMLSCSFLFEDDDPDIYSGSNFMRYKNWIVNGGQFTIYALQSESRGSIKYIFRYVEEAPLYETVEAGGRKFILTHGGFTDFDRNKPFSEYSKHDLLWSRPSLEDRYFDDVITVLGHTPTANYGSMYEGKILKTDTWINIDVGAAWGFPPALLRLDDLKEFYLE